MSIVIDIENPSKGRWNNAVWERMQTALYSYLDALAAAESRAEAAEEKALRYFEEAAVWKERAEALECGIKTYDATVHPACFTCAQYNRRISVTSPICVNCGSGTPHWEFAIDRFTPK